MVPEVSQRNFQRVSAWALGAESDMAFWAPLICSPAVQSLSHPGAPKGDGPGPDLLRLHWPTAAHRVPANNCTKNALAPGSLSRTRARARNFTFLWLSSRVSCPALCQRQGSKPNLRGRICLPHHPPPAQPGPLNTLIASLNTRKGSDPN